MEGKLDSEAGKPQEIAIVGAKRRAMLDGQGGSAQHCRDRHNTQPLLYIARHGEKLRRSADPNQCQYPGFRPISQARVSKVSNSLLASKQARAQGFVDRFLKRFPGLAHLRLELGTQVIVEGHGGSCRHILMLAPGIMMPRHHASVSARPARPRTVRPARRLPSTRSGGSKPARNASAAAFPVLCARTISPTRAL